MMSAIYCPYGDEIHATSPTPLVQSNIQSIAPSSILSETHKINSTSLTNNSSSNNLTHNRELFTYEVHKKIEFGTPFYIMISSCLNFKFA